MAESAILTNTTIAKYIRGFVDSTIRYRIMLAYLQKKGNILYNQGGTSINWRVNTIEPTVSHYTDGTTIDYASYDCYKEASLEYRSVKATDKLTDWQQEVNKGPEAIINLKSEIADRLLTALRNKFGSMLYADGNASGNERLPHGLNTMFGTQGTTVAADIVAKPAATYAGLSTAVGAVDTTWDATYTTFPNANIATNWPDPAGNSGYDYWSPRWLNYSSTNWGTGSTAWEDNCMRLIRKAHHMTTMSAGSDGEVDCVLLASNLYTGYLNKAESRFRISQPAPKLLEMGFNGVQQEGIEIARDFDCPASTGFGINFDYLFLHSMKSDLFYMDKPTKDPYSDALLYMTKFFGTLRCKTPKSQFKISAVA